MSLKVLGLRVCCCSLDRRQIANNSLVLLLVVFDKAVFLENLSSRPSESLQNSNDNESILLKMLNIDSAAITR